MEPEYTIETIEPRLLAVAVALALGVRPPLVYLTKRVILRGRVLSKTHARALPRISDAR